MNRLVKVIGVAALVALVAVALVGVVAFAQEPEDGADGTFNWRERLHQAIADALGIGVEQYDTAVETAGQQVLDEAVTEGWLTQEQAERMQERMAEGYGPGMGMYGGRGGMMGGRGGMMGGQGGWGGMMAGQSSLLDVAAGELGMTVDELVAELEAGQTIAGVAAAKGVEPQEIVDAFIAARAAWMAQAVEDGRMTQEQVDAMLDHMSEQVLEHLSQPYTGNGGPGGCFGGGRGPGMMGPGRYQNYPGTDES